MNTRRITLISRNPNVADRDWNAGPGAASKLVILGFTAVRCSVTKGLVDMDLDVERIVIDRSASATDFLSLLSNLPDEFRGDVLFIREDDSAFLSSTGRGGDRLLYALAPVDLRFYLEMNSLLTTRIMPRISPALPMVAFQRAVA